MTQRNGPDLALPNITEMMFSDGVNERVLACLYVIEHGRGREDLLDPLRQMVNSPENKRYKAMGKRICDLAVAAMLAIDTQAAERAAMCIIQSWTREERYDILSWANRLELMNPNDLAEYEQSQRERSERIAQATEASLSMRHEQDRGSSPK